MQKLHSQQVDEKYNLSMQGIQKTQTKKEVLPKAIEGDQKERKVEDLHQPQSSVIRGQGKPSCERTITKEGEGVAAHLQVLTLELASLAAKCTA